MPPQWQRVMKGLTSDEVPLVEKMSLKAGHTGPLALMGKGLICDIKEKMIHARNQGSFGCLDGLKEDASEVLAQLRADDCINDREMNNYLRLFAEI